MSGYGLRFDRTRLRVRVAQCMGVLLCTLALQGAAMAQSASVAASSQAGASPDELLALGQRIYREAVDSTGQPIKAMGPAGVVLSGKDAACVTCHRRSGYGSSEGQYTARPVTAHALFQEQTQVEHLPRVKAQLGTRQRAAYDDALLARAVRGGLDASGKPLDPVMPRFALSDTDVRALAAYLATLSLHDSPGVGEEEIHFATVIQPGVSAERRRAMLDVMQAFVKDKTSNVRSNEQRRQAGTMRMNRSYRKWVLQVWELSGPSEGWNAQLQDYYDRQPVFALIGGLGHASWKPIHAFAERLQIPSVFAQTDLPDTGADNFYNFYFSRGLTLEAEVLARYLREQTPQTVLQIYRANEAGQTAATQFRRAMAAQTVQDLVLQGPADATFWAGVAAARPTAVVLWLSAADLADLPALSGESLALYSSYVLPGGKVPAALYQGGSNVRLVYPSEMAPRYDTRLLRSKIWLHNKGIALTDEATQVNAQFAMTVVSDALGHIMDSFSRDLFVERVEHMVGQTPAPSIYKTVSLGPGQRFAAKGSSIVQLGEKGQLKLLSDWIVP